MPASEGSLEDVTDQLVAGVKLAAVDAVDMVECLGISIGGAGVERVKIGITSVERRECGGNGREGDKGGKCSCGELHDGGCGSGDILSLKTGKEMC